MAREHDAERGDAIEREAFHRPDGEKRERARQIRRAVDRLDREQCKRDQQPRREQHNRPCKPVLKEDAFALHREARKQPRQLCRIRMLKDQHRRDEAEEQGIKQTRIHVAIDENLHRPEISARDLRA